MGRRCFKWVFEAEENIIVENTIKFEEVNILCRSVHDFSCFLFYLVVLVLLVPLLLAWLLSLPSSGHGQQVEVHNGARGHCCCGVAQKLQVPCAFAIRTHAE